jgi:vancomycin resistance protein YoaR
MKSLRTSLDWIQRRRGLLASSSGGEAVLEWVQGRRMLLGALGGVLALGLLYGVMAVFLAGHVASNVSVDGVDVGGMSPREAEATLNRELVTQSTRPVELTAQSRSVDIQPAAAGLQIDVAATVSGLTGFTMNPLRLWSHLTGTQDSQPQYRVDRAKLTAAVTKAADTLDRTMKQGSITFTGGRVTKVVSVVGSKVRVPETAEAVVAAWPRSHSVKAVTKITQPRVSADEISRAAKEFADPAMSAPVTFVAGDSTFDLRPSQYAPALSTVVDATGRLRLKISMRTLLTEVRAAAPGVEDLPVDASVRLVAGKPKIVPAVAGTRFDGGSSTSAGFRSAVTSASGRTVTLILAPASPKVTTAAVQGWQISAPISTFTTQFPVNPPRTNNIKIAVAALNGTLIRPGGQFSLNATLGERTAAKGYQKAPVIYGGRLVSDYGGGVSQVSTTTYNAAFFAGVRIDQILAHSFYIARYPEGREATVSWPDVDQKWTNDTGSGILIQASVQGSDLSVTLWGTKKWDIEAVKGPRRNVVKPKVIVDPKTDCVPQQPTPGFDVTVTQVFKKDGARVRQVGFNTHYIPEDTVTCSHVVAP